MATSKRFELWDMDAGMLIDRDVNLATFATTNDLEPEELNAIGRLEVRESTPFGGGAATLYSLRRVA